MLDLDTFSLRIIGFRIKVLSRSFKTNGPQLVKIRILGLIL